MKLYRTKLVRCLIALFSIIGVSTDLCATEPSEPVVIGILNSSQFPFAEMMKNSFEMALKVMNEEGGIKGGSLKLVYADDEGKREAGEKAVESLVKDSGAVILVGGYSSSNTLHTARLADKLDIPFLITTAADDRITQRKWRNVYRINPPAKEYTKGVEELLKAKIKPASMAILYENSPYGTGAALRMMWFCRENDIAIRKIVPYHKERASPSYFQDLLAPLREDLPDVIFMVSYLKDAVSMVKEIRKLKIHSLLIGGAGGFTHPRFIAMAEEAAEGLFTATLWNRELPYPGSQEYYHRYLQKHSVPPDYHGAEAYAALIVAADALNRAESLRPDSIRKALDATDIQTPFGPVNFKSYENFDRQNSLPTMVLQIKNRGFEVVWPNQIPSSKSKGQNIN